MDTEARVASERDGFHSLGSGGRLSRRRPIPGPLPGSVQGGAGTGWLRTALLLLAAALTTASIYLPLWGMNLVSVQYPEGLRLVVFPTRIAGDVVEINMLNHYIGMAPLEAAAFPELRLLPSLLVAGGLLILIAAAVRRWWLTALPLILLGGTAVYGLGSMRARLYQFGHELDPTAAMQVEPFTPPMIGENVLAQFGTYSYFSWGTALPLVAGLILLGILLVDLRGARSALKRSST